MKQNPLIRRGFLLRLLFRIFPGEQLVQLVAANVAEILAFNEVEDVLADVLAAVADTLD